MLNFNNLQQLNLIKLVLFRYVILIIGANRFRIKRFGY